MKIWTMRLWLFVGLISLRFGLSAQDEVDTIVMRFEGATAATLGLTDTSFVRATVRDTATQLRSEMAGLPTDNIYTANGTLTGNRTVGLSSYDLILDGTSSDTYFKSSGNIGIGTSSPTQKIEVSSTSAATSGLYYGALFNPVLTSPSTATTIATGLTAFLQTGGSANNTAGSVNGLWAYTLNANTGTVTTLRGLYGLGRNFSTGTATNAYGVFGMTQNDNAGGIITNSYSVYGANPTKIAGTITNAYGVYSENITSGTNNFGVYSAGGTNYFSGNVGIGTTTPGYPLEVNGHIKFGQFVSSTNLLQSTSASVRGARIRAAVSSAANPTFSFEDDTNTGMFSGTADILGFSTGGTDRLNIGATGALTASAYGAGSITGTPTYIPLFDTNGKIIEGTLADYQDKNIYEDNGTLTGNRAVTMGSYSLNFDANTFFISGLNNYVGIGTSTPDIPLFTIGAGAGIGGTAYRVAAFTQDQTNYRGIYLGYDTGGQIGVVSAGGTEGEIAFRRYSSSWKESARIDNNGNLGIGTATPAAKLEITAGSTNTQVLKATGTLTANVAGVYYGFASTGGEGNGMLIDGGGVNVGRYILRGRDAALNQRFIFLANGNAGIGNTLAPTEKLHVSGGNVRFDSYGAGAITGNGKYKNMWVDTSGKVADVSSTLLTSDGTNVGIGISSPDATFKLHIKDVTYAQMKLDATGANDVAFTFAQSGTQVAKMGYSNSAGLFKIIAGSGPFSTNSFTMNSLSEFAFGTTPETGIVLKLKDGGATGMSIDATGANDSYTTFNQDGVQVTKIGYDDSDAAFKINAGTATFAATHFAVKSSGNVGIGIISPTAALHIKAGTTAANTAPFKLTSGPVNTTQEAGAIEYDGTNLFYTNSVPTRFTVANIAGTQTFTNKTISGASNTITNVPISTGVSGLGTGVATFLATPSSANLIAAFTDETGTGALVFGTSPAITTSITTPSTTFSIANTTATTLNIGGASTATAIGSSSSGYVALGKYKFNSDQDTTAQHGKALVYNGVTREIELTTVAASDDQAIDSFYISNSGILNVSLESDGEENKTVPINRYAIIKDIKSSGTNGGTFTSGSYQIRTLNTLEVIGTQSDWVTLSSNQFTLTAGSYYIEAYAPALWVDYHKAKIYNTTDSADTILGSTAHSTNSSAGMTNSIIQGVITITGTKTYELRHRGLTTRTNIGFGNPAGFGDNEVYSMVKIQKIN